jgi:hypothetical protein
MSPLVEKLKLLIEKISTVESVNPKEFTEFKDLNLFCMKPFLIGLNISDSDSAEKAKRSFVELVKGSEAMNISNDLTSLVFPIAVKLENEASTLDYEERKEFYDQIEGYEGLSVLSKKAFNELGLINFFTAGKDEVRSWEIKNGSKAPQAAGKIHTDFEKKFIRANVIHWDELVQLGGFVKAKDAGKIRGEGKEYIVKDGDVLEIMHG